MGSTGNLWERFEISTKALRWQLFKFNWSGHVTLIHLTPICAITASWKLLNLFLRTFPIQCRESQASIVQGRQRGLFPVLLGKSEALHAFPRALNFKDDVASGQIPRKMKGSENEPITQPKSKKTPQLRASQRESHKERASQRQLLSNVTQHRHTISGHYGIKI